jgi:hypothetical protein
MKKSLPYILLGVVVLVIVTVQYYAPKPINWDETFQKKDKNPYGNALLYDRLSDLFPKENLVTIDKTIYEHLDYFHYEEEEATEEITNIDELYIEDTTEVSEYQEYENESSQELSASETIEEQEQEPIQEEEELKNTRIIRDAPIHNNPGEEEPRSSYIFINTTFNLAKTDCHSLFHYVESGNTAFIAARNMYGIFADSLKLDFRNSVFEDDFSTNDLTGEGLKDSLYLILFNESLPTDNKKYRYRSNSINFYFSSYDTARTVVLGENSRGQATLIRVRHGLGSFILSSTPLAFTNYNLLLEDNAEYIAGTFSYLPAQNIVYWDEYYKDYRPKHSKGSLHFIEEQPPLIWAFYLAVWGAIVYTLFEIKRRQRIIPIIEPLKNTTVEFVTTIGQLYFHKRDNKDLADKKIHYFLEYIRAHFYTSTSDFDQTFIEKISERSGIEATKVQQLFSMIKNFQYRTALSDTDLTELNKRIEEFRKQSKV